MVVYIELLNSNVTKSIGYVINKVPRLVIVIMLGGDN
jgi:hypothetical protein